MFPLILTFITPKRREINALNYLDFLSYLGNYTIPEGEALRAVALPDIVTCAPSEWHKSGLINRMRRWLENKIEGWGSLRPSAYQEYLNRVHRCG